MSTDADIIIALARKLEAENTRLRAENTRLRAGQGRWPKEDLEDTPVKNVDTTPATRKENGENCTRPLTVHKLNTAPVGSVVISGTLVFTKNHDGDWISNDPALGYVPHEIAAITPDANATLTYPERGDHE